MNKRISIFLPSLDGGGAERVMLQLAQEFVSRGVTCDVVIAISQGQLLQSVPEGARLVRLEKSKTISATIALAKYLIREKPDALLSTVFTANLTALLAKKISFTSTRVITCEASPTDWDVKSTSKLGTLLNTVAARILYRFSDEIIAVSEGVRSVILNEHLARPERVHVIPNPAPKFAPPLNRSALRKRPLILACGRLEPQKDYETLLRAFALLRAEVDAELVVLGEGSRRTSLLKLSQRLGISQDFSLPGFDPEPLNMMSQASLFVHTAEYEGFGVVLLEALVAGCPVVATDCPGGVRDVLAQGKFGLLIPVGDEIRLAAAMKSVLLSEITFPDVKEHLEKFNLEAVADCYLKLLVNDKGPT